MKWPIMSSITSGSWAASAWTARIFIVVGDSWQWIPFIFVVIFVLVVVFPKFADMFANIADQLPVT